MSAHPAPGEAERALAGLTAAQREALVTAVGGPRFYLTRWKYGRSVMALHRAGLTMKPPPGGGGIIACLTPLGLAVRSLLQERNQ